MFSCGGSPCLVGMKLSFFIAALPASASIGGLRGVDTEGYAGRGMCGIATNMLDFNDAGMRTYCRMKLDFWWNWATVPTNIYSESCAWETFVPMIWGSDPTNEKMAKSGAAMLMGYNEPDLWGPPLMPGGDYLASGSFAPTFQCGNPALAKDWQTFVMSYKATNPTGQIISPSMADAEPGDIASTGESASCNASPQTPQQHMPWCPGWLKCFRDSVIQLDCGETNCWDVIDVLQFHAYAYTAEEVISKIRGWERLWADDLNGRNGRKKKTLWMTEFARAGAVDSQDADGKTRAFMKDIVEYMRESPFVSGWSWFSQDHKTFMSFPIKDRVPGEPSWTSELIDAQGNATVLGEYYARLCRRN
mmetsp:Transcript_3473/g.10084  ORF Transcript_3473/g.10084 Transcript_3473/m.10084 type:complete len:361 (-) Transcript_3473:186-1268(-)